MTQETQLLTLIEDYKALVKVSVNLLADKYIKDPSFLIHERTGFFDEERKIKYQFHGIGCLVNFDGLYVDFDFGYANGINGRCDGFDKWFLFEFFKERANQYPLLQNEKQIIELIDNMVVEGLIFRGEANIHYLKKDWENPNPVKLKWCD